MTIYIPLWVIAAVASALICGAGFAAVRHRRWLRGLATTRPEHHFCPNCRAGLKQRDFDGKTKLACPRCRYVYWNNPMPVMVGVVPNEDNSGVLLVERTIPPKEGYHAFPGGFLETGEDAEKGVRRETKEETGVDVVVVKILFLITLEEQNELLIFFLCRRVGGEPTNSNESTNVAFYQHDQLPQHIAFQTHEQALAWWLANR